MPLRTVIAHDPTLEDAARILADWILCQDDSRNLGDRETHLYAEPFPEPASLSNDQNHVFISVDRPTQFVGNRIPHRSVWWVTRSQAHHQNTLWMIADTLRDGCIPCTGQFVSRVSAQRAQTLAAASAETLRLAELYARAVRTETTARVATAATPADLANQWARITALPGVSSVSLNSVGLVLHTTSFDLTDDDGYHYPVGPFNLHVSLGTDYQIGVYAPLDAPRADSGYIHPHVSINGEPCFGNISCTVAELWGRQHFADLALLLLDYLSSYNSDDPHLSLEHWCRRNETTSERDERLSCDGFDEEGFNEEGFNEEGYDRDGYDRDGYDSYGYDRDGYDSDGYDREGYDREGYDRDGYDCDGYDRDGKDEEDEDTDD